jgi:tetratricopeptide (TPR) repeat protein
VLRSSSRLRRLQAVSWPRRLLAGQFSAACMLVALTLFVPRSPFVETGRTAPAEINAAPLELKRRLEAQHAAVQSANPQTIIEASEKLVALALRQMGNWRVQQKAYAQAIELYRNSLLLDDSPETRAGLATGEEGAKQGREALPTDLDSVDPAAAPSTSVLKSAKLTPAQLQRGKLQEKRLRQILSTSYNDWGAAEARQQKYLQALIHFHEAERWSASTPGLMRNIGLAAAKVGDNVEAARALKVVVKHDPKDKVSAAILAISLFATERYANAAQVFGTLGDAAMTDPDMAYAWAFSLAHTNQPKQARAILEKLTSRQLPPEMLVSIGEVYNNLGEYEQALACFRKAVQQDPSIKKAHDDAGSALIRLDRPAEAIPELQAELKLNPDEPDTQYRLAYALLQTSQEDQAIIVLRTLVAAHPNHARARYDLGKELLETGKTEEAIQNLEVAAKLAPERAYVHYQLQSAYRKAERTSDADRELQLYRQIKERDRGRTLPQTEAGDVPDVDR